MKQIFSTTKNGIEVYLDTEHSHALTHFARHPKLADAVNKVVADLEITEDSTRIESEMDEVVGTTDLVETSDQDEIVYALRPLRSIYSRFVKNKEPTPSKWITIHIKKQRGVYTLYTAFVGRSTPSFPGGDYLPEQSKEFWSRHALVWGSQEIVPGSETTICPWD